MPENLRPYGLGLFQARHRPASGLLYLFLSNFNLDDYRIKDLKASNIPLALFSTFLILERAYQSVCLR